MSVIPARAHDPSAWGGLFRSRDGGATWLPANPGRVVTGAIALAVSPADPAHLLLATDSGLLRSRNGGLDWEIEAPGVLIGTVFAVAVGADGQRALAATGSALYRTDDFAAWHSIPSPAGAMPARGLVTGASGEVYLLGWTGLHRSPDWSDSWTRVEVGEPGDAVTAFVPAAGPLGAAYAVAGGQLWASPDGGATWRPRPGAPSEGGLETVARDRGQPTRLWAVAGGQVVRSDDGGLNWQPIGRRLPEAGVATRAMAVASGGAALTLATDRGLYRSGDAGARWDLLVDNLPAHLEAWPLVHDPVDPATLYAGFALTPYPEMWRQAAEGGAALGRLSPASVAGGLAFLVLLGAVATLALRLLARHAAGPARAGSARR